MTLNHDLANMASPKDVAIASMAIIDSIQKEPPHIQMHAAAAVFLLLAEYNGEPAQDAFARTKNLMNHANEGRRAEFRAIEAYMEGEF